jgi:hypothetical protein
MTALARHTQRRPARPGRPMVVTWNSAVPGTIGSLFLADSLVVRHPPRTRDGYDLRADWTRRQAN